MARTSRVSREAHVRMCAGLEVKSLRSTRHFTLMHCVLVLDLTTMRPVPTKGRSEGVRAALSFVNTALPIPRTVGNLESASVDRLISTWSPLTCPLMSQPFLTRIGGDRESYLLEIFHGRDIIRCFELWSDSHSLSGPREAPSA